MRRALAAPAAGAADPGAQGRRESGQGGNPMRLGADGRPEPGRLGSLERVDELSGLATVGEPDVDSHDSASTP